MSRRDTPDRLSGNAFRAFVNGFHSLLVSRHRSAYDMGRALSQIREERLWNKWPRRDRDRAGYRDWAEWSDRVMGYSGSTTDQLIYNYRHLSALRLDEDGPTFSRALRLGWSKLVEVLRVVNDETTLVAWLDYIEAEELSLLQLRAKIREALHGPDEDDGDGDEGEGDEAGDGDDVDEEEDEEETGIPWTCRFPDNATLDTIINATETVQRRLGQNVGVGRALGLICTHYLGTAPRIDEGGPVVELDDVLRAIETNYGVTLRVVQNARRRRRRSRTARAQAQQQRTRG